MDERRERKDQGKVNPDDYYAVLGVLPSATNEEIKRAFRRLALEFHPDRTKGNKASVERFLVVKDAYETLRDDELRAVYDQAAKARGGSGYERRDAGGEGSAERKSREFLAWYNEWMNIGNSRGLYQEAMNRFQNRQPFNEVQQWAQDEIKRKCREGEVLNIEFYSTGVNQLLEQAQNAQLGRERKKELKFRESFDAWINTQSNEGFFQEILEKLRRGEDEQDIEQFACDKLKERIHKANIAPHISRDDYFIQGYEMLRSAFAFYAEENRRRELDAWVKSVETWAYGEMKNNVSYAAVLEEAEKVARDGISSKEGLERYLRAVRDALVRARETLERERRKK
ncbi:J domain-containing protein [bacterium]|nr:J domain-containing protein [bacterium]